MVADELRVEELAALTGASVDVIRSYQSKGLLPPPRHEGRLALYDQRHVERLKTIRDLKARGHSLRAIVGLLEEAGPPMARNRAIADAVATTDDGPLTISEMAERTRVPPAMLRSLEASGVLRPQSVGGERRYTAADVRAVRMLLALVGSGVPMEEFMEVADVQLQAADTVARGAVDLFLRYIREPLIASHMPAEEEAEQLVASFRLLLQASGELIMYNFQRTVLNVLQAEISERGSEAERALLEQVVAEHRLEVARPA
jgi:DNA-binding transcriptional MerR regulator